MIGLLHFSSGLCHGFLNLTIDSNNKLITQRRRVRGEEIVLGDAAPVRETLP